MKLSGWGRFPVIDSDVSYARSVDDIRDLLVSNAGLIARGNGRAYGDSAIGALMTVDMQHLNHFVAFDEQTGQLVAQAGVLLKDIISAFLPRGWFVWVTPGTKFVTLGGMIAADVHGKNHHCEGSLRRYVDWIDVMIGDGTVIRCSHSENAELFEYTIGGMGLTGVILQAAIRLRPVQTGWIRQTTLAPLNLAAALDIFASKSEATYSVAWIDCLSTGSNLGRSVIMLGEHASIEDLPAHKAVRPFETPIKRRRQIPFDLPTFALNRYSIRAFNSLYYRAGYKRSIEYPTERLVDWDSFFYPLDAITGWNRMYGRKGFAQFQCVIPLEHAAQGLTTLLKTIAEQGSGSFLAVLKRLGPGGYGISFPMEGYTLALDFPISERTLSLLERLDAITLDHAGRFYLAKDSRMKAKTLIASDTRIEQFLKLRGDRGWIKRFRSAQSERLSI